MTCERIPCGYGIYSVLFLGVFCVVYNASEFANLFFVYPDLQPLASDLSWFLVHFVGCIKIGVFLANGKNLGRICERFVSGLCPGGWGRGLEEARIFGRAVEKSRRYLAVYYAFSVVVLLNGFVAPAYRGHADHSNPNTTRPTQRLPYYTYVHCDAGLSPCYEIAYVYQILSTCVSSLVLVHCDNLYIVLVMLCCAEFRALGRSLENIDEDAGRIITECVKHHHAILEVSEELEGIYNLLILAQFLSHLVQICFQLFLVSEVSALSFDGLSMIAFAIAMVIEVYVFCQCGNEIETESTRVSEAAYNARWTSSSEPAKRALLLVMTRAQRPVRFTAGKFAKLSLGVLVSVLKGSFSYFMVLRGFQQ